MTAKTEEGDLLLKQNEDGMIARLKMFIHLRQDLERVCETTLVSLGQAKTSVPQLAVVFVAELVCVLRYCSLVFTEC